jgi:hypothetical protein
MTAALRFQYSVGWFTKTAIKKARRRRQEKRAETAAEREAS